MMRWLFVISISLAAAGCGAMAGAACSGEGAQQCSGSSVLLVCENAKWVSYTCPTCAGSTCNWKGAMNGDACPHSAESQGTCNFDGRVVSCYWSAMADAGVFVEQACPACMAGKSLEELGKCNAQGRCSCN